MPREVVKEELVETMKDEEVCMETPEAEEEEEEHLDYDEGDDDEWDELTMVVTVNGILDADLIRDAVQKDIVRLRYAETDAPVLQINNSLYTGTWTQDLGTNIVLEAKGKDVEVISCTSTMLTAEKALLTSMHPEGSTTDAAPRSALSRTQPRGK